MKRLSTIIMALVLALGLTQCEKEQPATNDINQGETYTINLSVKGNNGAKADVNTTTGAVDYAIGDQIHVASNGKYVGTLTYDGQIFTGNIANAVEGEPLQFYFLGNVAPAEELTSGVTESCSVVITDQTQHFPVISGAPSNEDFYGNVTDYTAMLLNKCALVKFSVTTAAEAATCLAGFNNKVTVDFGQNTFTNSQEGNGIITLPAGNGEKWAILLPQEAMTGGNAYAADESYIGTFGAVPALYANGMFTVGIPVEVNTVAPFNPLTVFSVSATTTVQFSPGNLQYNGSTSTWRFAEHQWDYIGAWNTSSWVDLFGWGTWGEGKNPLNTSTNNNDYTWTSDFSGTISNDNQTGWRTLTNPEWEYVFNTRTTTSGIRYAKAEVNQKTGIILLPDNWDSETYTLNNTNDPDADYTSNIINETDWTNVLEANGAVFLPSAGYRQGSSVLNVSVNGFYWSTTKYNATIAYCVYIFSGNFDASNVNFLKYGKSVRLVRNAE